MSGRTDRLAAAAPAPLICHSPKLGSVPYSAVDVIRFPHGLPGFEHLREFLLVTRDECAPFVFLASLEDLQVTLPLLPWALAGGQHILAAEDFRTPDDETDAMVVPYAVVSIGPQGREVAANLRAPVVVNLDARLGRQVILADESLPLTATVTA
jgi:flagellar assembly factor FliW